MGLPQVPVRQLDISGGHGRRGVPQDSLDMAPIPTVPQVGHSEGVPEFMGVDSEPQSVRDAAEDELHCPARQGRSTLAQKEPSPPPSRRSLAR